jgi:hypothetical protein
MAVRLTSVIRTVKAYDTSSTTGAGKTALAFGDITATYRVDGGTLQALTTEDITTLGTYQAPSANTKIRIKKISDSDPNKGELEVHFHDDQLATGNILWLSLSASGATIAPLELDLANLRARIPDALPDAATGLVTTTAFQARTLAAASYATASAVAAIAAIFTGITSLAQWLGLIAGKQVGNSTARTELRATGAGSGTYDETTDSQEALKDLLPAALEAAILNEGDATALLAAIAAKVEEFLINEGDATATIVAIATAVNAAVTASHGSGSYVRNTEPDNTTITALQKLLRADRKIDKTTNSAHWDEVLLEEGTSTELVRRELFDADGTALAAETTRIGRAIKSP